MARGTMLHMDGITVGAGLKRRLCPIQGEVHLGEGDGLSITGGIASGKTGLARLTGSGSGDFASARQLQNETGRPLLRQLIPSDPRLMTVGLGGDVVGELVWWAIEESVVRRAIESFQLGGLLTRRVVDISGGEACRLAVALAVVSQPELLAVDEIGLQLDPDSLRVVQEELTSLRERGTALIETRQADSVSLMPQARELALGPGVSFAAGVADWCSHYEAEAKELAPAAIKAEGAAVRYKTGKVIGCYNLRAEAGDLVLLRGRNGAGKTSFFRLASGFAPLHSGQLQIEVGGRRLPDLRRAHASMFVLSQSPEYQMAGPTAADELDVTVGTSSDLAERFLQSGLGENISRLNVFELPTGVQRLVLMAKAMLSPCSVLMLDEPSVGMSEDAVSALALMITSAVAKARLVILSTHDNRLVQAVSEYSRTMVVTLR